MAMHPDEALEILYGNSVRNLTAEGYIQAIRELRKEDLALARRVERMLEPFLRERVFPRRRRVWHQTSEGTQARLALLPRNPHVEVDIITARAALGLTESYMQALEQDPLWKHAKSWGIKPDSVKRVVEGNLIGCWLDVHRAAATDRPAPREVEDALSIELRESAVASAGVNLGASDVPEWLRRPPSGPAPYDKSAVPVDWAAGRLVERHHLPWRTGVPLTFFILSLDKVWVRGLESLEVSITYGGPSSDDPAAFNVTVKGVDEFVTKADWDRIWKQYVRQRQARLWERRGMKPQGRRTTDIVRLQKALPLYRQMVLEDICEKELLGGASTSWDDETATLDWDQETVRRAIQGLRELLTPEA